MGARGPKPASDKNVAKLNVIKQIRLSPPRYLRPDAAAAWREVVAAKPAGFFTESDIPVLEAYAMQVAISREAYALLAACKAMPVAEAAPPPISQLPGMPAPPKPDDGEELTTTLVQRSPNGYVAENALLRVLNTAHNQLAALATKLNLAGTFREGRKADKGKGKADDAGRTPGRAGLMFQS